MTAKEYRFHYLVLSTMFLATAVEVNAVSRGEMPLLSMNVNSDHFGYLEGLDAINSGQQAALDEMHAEAVANGLDVERIFTSWKALNPEEGQYDLETLQPILEENFANGLKTYVSVTTLDSEGLADVPDRFLSDTSPTGLSTTWSSSEMIGQYEQLMDIVVPLCEANGGFAISVANEPQFYFEDTPEADPSDFVAFFSAIVEHIHSISSSVAVTITLANHELSQDTNMQMLALSDVVSLNLYGGVVDDPEEWLEPIKAAEALVAPKQIVFQEMGYSSDSAGATIGQQAQYVETLSAYLQESEQLRVYYWFLIHDPQDAFIDLFRDELYGLPQYFIDQVADSLSGLGMCTLTGHSCRIKEPTWDAYLSELRRISLASDSRSLSTATSASTTSASTLSPSSSSLSSSPSTGLTSPTAFQPMSDTTDASGGQHLVPCCMLLLVAIACSL